MNVPLWRRIVYVMLVLALAASAVAHLHILPLISTLLLGLSGLALARPRLVSLPAAFAAQFLFIIGAALEGATIGAAVRHDVADLALVFVFVFPVLGLVAPGNLEPPASPLPVARVTRRR